MLRIRRLETADLRAADDMLRAAFRAQVGFQPRLRRYLALQPDGWLAADDDGQLIGTVGAIDYGTFAYIGLMAVRPDRQGQHVGRKLLDAVLAILDERGTPCAVLDASPAGAPLYEGRGFIDAGLSHEFSLAESDAAPPPATEDESDVAVSVAGLDELDDIVKLEARYFGVAREPLWRWLFAMSPTGILAARDPTGALVGYLCMQDALLGPFGAGTPATAAALLRHALRHLGPRNARMQVPEDNAAAPSMLAQAGFRLTHSLRHMRRGSCPSLLPWTAIYGKASYCLG